MCLFDLKGFFLYYCNLDTNDICMFIERKSISYVMNKDITELHDKYG